MGRDWDTGIVYINVYSLNTCRKQVPGAGEMIIFSYFVLVYLVGGRRVSGVPLNYSMPGHTPVTSAHVMAHKIPI